ncbi:MAG: 3-octaprenyl-4-hydroxybenzoate carboxy-lyase [Bacteroidetes bacterium HGW-Bacteroidetes-22]|nr:MAG: 3-octaprenyl-4-hydroxybenzoate carboxy-lyase [Bacteroidetes bacterium HGW-Bacteroidetes-22]
MLGKKLLDRLRVQIPLQQRLKVLLTDTGREVWKYELGTPLPDDTGFDVYRDSDLFADIASGSAGYETMIVCPCSMGSVGRIASGVSSGLLTRAADVMLKERRRLVLVIREAPLSLIHLRNLTRVTEAGAIVFPASPFFYHKPDSMDELLDPMIDRILQTAGIEAGPYRWGS